MNRSARSAGPFLPRKIHNTKPWGNPKARQAKKLTGIAWMPADKLNSIAQWVNKA